MTTTQSAAIDEAPASRPTKTRRSRWPADVPHDPLVLSPWAADSVELRVPSKHGVRSLDLGAVPLPANADIGGPLERVATLRDFPHWMASAKAYLALALRETTGHSRVDIAINGLNHVLRFMAWCVRRRVYKFTDLTPADIQQFVRDMGTRGWHDAFGLAEKLSEIVAKAEIDPEFRALVTTKCRRNSHISAEGISQYLGLLVTGAELPKSFRLEMARVAGTQPPKRLGGRAGEEWTSASFSNCIGAIARLSRLPQSLDRLVFHPSFALQTVTLGHGRPMKRTPNLPVEDGARLFATALTWIYTRAPGVIELVRIWRASLVAGTGKYADETSVIASVCADLRDAYPSIRAKHGLPALELTAAMRAAKDEACVVDFVSNVLTSALVLVGVNQARRKNEVLGEDGRPFGLYRGCVKSADPFVDAFEIDMYIEKTIRGWRSMSCSRLVADVVLVLEQLRSAMLPDEEAASSEDAREQLKRLFVLPSHKAMLGQEEPTQYCFATNSRALFAEAGIADEMRRTHIFRRMFAMLYMYRFDHPSLQALSETLYHLDLDCTRIYVTDGAMVEESARIERLYRQHQLDQRPWKELDTAAKEYADYQINAMLTSSGAGGPLTRRVRTWVRKIGLKVELPVDPAELTSLVVAELERKSYRPTSFAHGVCWASGPRFAARAGCGSAGRLNRDRAGVLTCGKCPFHSTSVAFLENLKRDIGGLEQLRSNAGSEEEVEMLASQIEDLNLMVGAELALIARSASALKSDGMDVCNGDQ